MIPAAAIDRFTLKFRDPLLEQQYGQVEDEKALQIMRFGILAGALLFAVASLVLVYFVPNVLRESVDAAGVWRAAIAVVLVGAAGYAATFTPPFQRHPQPALAALCAVAALGFAAVLRNMPPDFVASRGFMFLVLHIFSIYSLLRLRLLPATAAGWSALALFVLAMRGWRIVDDITLWRQVFWLVACNLWGTVICYQVERGLRREFASSLDVQHERARAEGLLLNILPAAIAQRLKTSQQRIAEHAEPVTVLFADIVGFTPLSARMQPGELVELLDRVFTEFDTLAAEHGLEKIKTIGDAYMAVAGLPRAQADHALRAARMALAMLQRVRLTAAETGQPLQLRVGLHTGPVVAGVIGRSKFSYDLWGDTVNTASRMESLGLAGAVHCTTVTADCLRGAFALQSRGHIAVKGKDTMETFLVAAPGSELSPGSTH